ncbi:hypothetical protein CQJ94_11370 [Glycomyces fuscus]|nr:hypothetical protein CQJ94_11370 [Glycomyces fuscus]
MHVRSPLARKSRDPASPIRPTFATTRDFMDYHASERIHSVSPFGMQREILLRAQRDTQGNPRIPCHAPVFESMRIDGFLDTDLFSLAVRMVLEEADVLQGRLRENGGSPILVRDTERSEPLVAVIDLTGSSGIRRKEKLGYVLTHTRSAIRDLQDGPLCSAVIARLSGSEHVLGLAFDHSVADQATLYRSFKLIGDTYGRLSAGDRESAVHVARSPGFFSHAHTTQNDGSAHEVAEATWRPAAEVKPTDFAFPGGRWKPWTERRVSVRTERNLTNEEVNTLRDACELLGTTVTFTFLASLSLVLAGVTGGFVPVTYTRHGRQPAREPVLGPLWETVLTRDPGKPRPRLSTWARQFCDDNIGSPSMNGTALVDFVGLDQVMEGRRVALNVVQSLLPFRTEGLRWEKLRGDEVVEPGIKPPGGTAHNVGVRIVLKPDGIALAIQQDPDDLPDGSRLDAAIMRAISLMARAPDKEFGKAVEAVGREMG